MIYFISLLFIPKTNTRRKKKTEKKEQGIKSIKLAMCKSRNCKKEQTINSKAPIPIHPLLHATYFTTFRDIRTGT